MDMVVEIQKTGRRSRHSAEKIAEERHNVSKERRDRSHSRDRSRNRPRSNTRNKQAELNTTISKSQNNDNNPQSNKEQNMLL